jgi:hypothetical protein
MYGDTKNALYDCDTCRSRNQLSTADQSATNDSSPRPMNLHKRRNQTQLESTNWSGYAVTTASGSTFTNVNGSWIVPTVNCSSSGTQTAASSFWIGIDGFNSSTVEQIGTDSDCDSTTNRRGGTTTVSPTYYAWFEFYPSGSFVIQFPTPIQPGHLMNASVVYAGTQSLGFGRISSTEPKFTVTITDMSTGQSFSTTAAVSGAQQASAEWVAEAPSSNTGVLPLSNFGSVMFNGAGSFGTASIATGGTSTIQGLGSFPSANIQELTMVSARTETIKAAPTRLSGNAFSVSWENIGP